METNPFCACGCGQAVLRNTKTNSSRGHRKGEWGRFKRGHWGKHTSIAENLSATDRNEYMRQWRVLNIETVRVRERANYQRLRMAVLSHYSGGAMRCACCAESELAFLTIDHIVPIRRQNRDSRHGGTALYSRLRSQGFPDGFQVLCYNCNCAKGANGECPHKLNPDRMRIPY